MSASEHTKQETTWQEFASKCFVIPPKDEYQFWQVMEALGAQRHFFSHTANHPRKGPETEEGRTAMMQTATDIARVQERLASEICERFNVVPVQECPAWTRNHDLNDEYTDYSSQPDEQGKYPVRKAGPPPPEGKIYYWHWYRKWKAEWIKNDLKTMICQACPYAREHDARSIPCSKFQGWASQLNSPYECLITREDRVPEETFLLEMKNDYGQQAVDTWLSMKSTLMAGIIMENGSFATNLEGAYGRTVDGHPFFITNGEQGWDVVVYDRRHVVIGFHNKPQIQPDCNDVRLVLLSQKNLYTTLEETALILSRTDMSLS